MGIIDMLTRRRQLMDGGDASGGRAPQSQQAGRAAGNQAAVQAATNPAERLSALEQQVAELRTERDKLAARMKRRRSTKYGLKKA